MAEVKIPFGRSTTGIMVSIDAVMRGLACECFCAACDAPLVACQGEKNQHHFRHYSERDCKFARETALHKFAKQLICEVPTGQTLLRLPNDLDLGAMRSAANEPWLDGIRPDVLAEFDEPVAIEVRVAHPVPPEKIAKLTIRQLATLEIDLSGYRGNIDASEDVWRQVILTYAHRAWLVQPAVMRLAEERRAREAAERRAYAQAQVERDQEFRAQINAEMARRAQQKRAEDAQKLAADLEFTFHGSPSKTAADQKVAARVERVIAGLSPATRRFFQPVKMGVSERNDAEYWNEVNDETRRIMGRKTGENP